MDRQITCEWEKQRAWKPFICKMETSTCQLLPQRASTERGFSMSCSWCDGSLRVATTRNAEQEATCQRSRCQTFPLRATRWCWHQPWLGAPSHPGTTEINQVMLSRKQTFSFEGFQRRSSACAWFAEPLVQALQDEREQIQYVPLGGALKMFPPQREAPTHLLMRCWGPDIRLKHLQLKTHNVPVEWMGRIWLWSLR